MRKIEIVVSVCRGFGGQDIEDTIEVFVKDNASEEDIEKSCDEAARDYFYELCNYGWRFAEEQHEGENT